MSVAPAPQHFLEYEVEVETFTGQLRRYLVVTCGGELKAAYMAGSALHAALRSENLPAGLRRMRVIATHAFTERQDRQILDRLEW